MKNTKQNRLCSSNINTQISLYDCMVLLIKEQPELSAQIDLLALDFSEPGQKKPRAVRSRKNKVCVSKTDTEITLYECVAEWEKEKAAASKARTAPDWHEMVEKNLGLVRSRIGKVHGVNANNRDDLEQAGMIALIKAVQGFNPAMGYQFSSYAVPAIDRAMRRELEYLQGRINTDSLEELQEEGDYKLGSVALSSFDEIYQDTEQRDLERLVDDVCAKLTRTKDIKAVRAVAMQLCGASPDEIARANGLSRRSYSAYISIGRQILSSNPHILEHISVAGQEYTSEVDATLLGERFTITVERHVHIDMPVRSGSSGGFSLTRLAKTIEAEDIADYLLGEVPIGEEVILLDDDTKCGAVLRMGTDCAAVTSVYRHTASHSRKTICA